MKQTLVVALALLLGACSQSDRAKPTARKGPVGRPAIEVRSVLRALNVALAQSQGQRPDGFPDLKHVEVQLQAKTEIDAGGQVKFVVVSGGVDTSSTHSTSLTLEMEAPKEAAVPPEEAARRRPRSPIAQAILAAKRAYIGENQINAGPLGNFEHGDITVEIAFEISDKASADIDTGDLLPVGLSASGGVANGKAHTIKLVYGKR